MRKTTSLISATLASGMLAVAAGAAAAQDADPPAPTAAWVTGTIGWATSCTQPTSRVTAGVQQERGAGCAGRTVTSDDPRLAGSSTIAWSKDVHATGTRRYAIRSMTEDIRGDGGGWVCRTSAVLDEGLGHFHTPVQGTDAYTCIGDGANAGLMAILVIETAADGTRQDPFEGLIFRGAPPAAPEVSPSE